MSKIRIEKLNTDYGSLSERVVDNTYNIKYVESTDMAILVLADKINEIIEYLNDSKT